VSGSPLLRSSQIVRIVPVQTNGTTPVVLVSGVTDNQIYLLTLLFSNESASNQVLLLKSGDTDIARVQIPASGTGVLDLRGDIRTNVSDALTMSLTTADVTTVYVSGAVIQQQHTY